MSPDEFMKTVKPEIPVRAASKLEPHRAAIEQLRAAGYSLRQVCEYLEHCGVSVTFQVLSKFLRGPVAPTSKTAPGESVRPAQPLPAPIVSQVPANETEPAKKSREDIARENPGLTKKQIDERYVDQYQTRVENPLLRRRNSQ
jgi:hypothetical protein